MSKTIGWTYKKKYALCFNYFYCKLFSLQRTLTAMHTLSTWEEGRSRLFAPGCWPGSVMFAEIDLSMNAGDICSAQFNHMPVLLLLFPNKLHHFSTTSLCLACLFQVVLMQTVSALETELEKQRLKEKIPLNQT